MNFPQPADDRCLIYLVRHGATENNIANPPRLQGRSVDLGLSSTGQWQAERVAGLLRNQPITALYASPLKRAQETAATIAAPHRLEVGSVEAIAEVDVGEWEGRSWVDIEREEPEAYLRFMTTPDQHGYVGGENLTQVRDRVLPAITSVAERHKGEAIVVVGHNVVNRCFLATALNVPLRHGRSLSQENCGVNLIRFVDSFKVVTLNSVFHLQEAPVGQQSPAV